MTEISKIPAVAKHVAQFTGIAMVEPVAAKQIAQSVSRMNMEEHKKEPARPPLTYAIVRPGLAALSIAGVLVKHRASIDGMCSTLEARQAVRAALRDEAVESLLLVIDSPGGMVAGTFDLYEDLVRFSEHKKLFVRIEDTCCSGALLLAMAGDEIVSNSTAVVGSIGAYMTVLDFSVALESAGLKLHMISSGELKGAGTPGTKITDNQVAMWQRQIDATAEQFKAIVRGARSIKEDVFDGRVMPAADAVRVGLIDRIESIDETIAKIAASAANHSGGIMPAEQSNGSAGAVVNPAKEQPVAVASANELKQKFPDAPAEFILDQLEKGATAEQATAAFVEFQRAAIRSRDEELKKSRASNVSTPVADMDIKPDAAAAAVAANPVELLHARRDELMQEHKWTRVQAVSWIRKNEKSLVDAACAYQTANDKRQSQD